MIPPWLELCDVIMQVLALIKASWIPTRHVFLLVTIGERASKYAHMVTQSPFHPLRLSSVKVNTKLKASREVFLLGDISILLTRRTIAHTLGVVSITWRLLFL